MGARCWIFKAAALRELGQKAAESRGRKPPLPIVDDGLLANPPAHRVILSGSFEARRSDLPARAAAELQITKLYQSKSGAPAAHPTQAPVPVPTPA